MRKRGKHIAPAPELALKFESELKAGLRGRMLAQAMRIVGNMEDAEDVTQIATLRAFNALHRYRHEATFSTWCFRIVFNSCMNFIKTRRSAKSRCVVDLGDFDDDWISNIAIDAETPEDICIANEAAERISRRIERMPIALRQITEMVFLQGMTYDDAAQQTGIPAGTVRSRVHRARGMIEEACCA